MRIAVMLVDDQKAYRGHLKRLLARQADLRVVADVDSGQAAVAAACTVRLRDAVPAVCLMDVGMPKVDGIQTTRHLMAACPRWRVLALSSHDDPSFVRAMLDAGACGYLLKQDPLPELLRALRCVASGGRAFSGALRDFSGEPMDE